MDCGLPGPSVHGILQARILEWVCHFLLHTLFQISIVKVLLIWKVKIKKSNKTDFKYWRLLYTNSVVNSQFSCYLTSQCDETELSSHHPLIALPSVWLLRHSTLGFPPTSLVVPSQSLLPAPPFLPALVGESVLELCFQSFFPMSTLIPSVNPFHFKMIRYCESINDSQIYMQSRPLSSTADTRILLLIGQLHLYIRQTSQNHYFKLNSWFPPILLLMAFFF